MAATLNRSRAVFRVGDAIPSVWHWLYFLPAVRTDGLGHDGHPPRGDFLPPIAADRRMRAGGKFEFRHSLRVGDTLHRRSQITSVSEKTGTTGPLVFVVIRHEITRAGVICVLEDESIVYRQETAGGSRLSSADSHARKNRQGFTGQRVLPDPALLFRFSALTFNSHRIHYDLKYAMEVEGYPALVVQGPLIALLVLEHLNRQRPDAPVESFEYRSIGPVYCGEDICIVEDSIERADEVHARAFTSTRGDAVLATATYADTRA